MEARSSFDAGDTDVCPPPTMVGLEDSSVIDGVMLEAEPWCSFVDGATLEAESRCSAVEVAMLEAELWCDGGVPEMVGESD